MPLNSLTNTALLTKTKNLVAEERRITAQVLQHLLEIENRRLFAEMGYSSLFEFCTRELQYSDSAAYRRISAMRLLKQIPEAESKIVDGRLSVTNASLLQSFFAAAKKEARTFSPEEKNALLGQVEGKSTRECEKVFVGLAPQAVRNERERVVSADATEIRFIADDDLLQMLRRIRELCAHRLDGRSDYATLFKFMARMVLKRVDPDKKENTAKENTMTRMTKRDVASLKRTTIARPAAATQKASIQRKEATAPEQQAPKATSTQTQTPTPASAPAPAPTRTPAPTPTQALALALNPTPAPALA